LTAVKGLAFRNVFPAAAWFTIDNGLSVRTLSLTDLLASKLAAGRSKDLDDIEHLNEP
jgi:hypothetical protein